MFKKIKTLFIILVVCIFWIQTSFWYEFSDNEKKVLNRVYSKINVIYNKNHNVLKKIYPKFKKLKFKYKRKIRFFNLLLEIEKYIWIKIENKSFINNWNNLIDLKYIKKIKHEQDNQNNLFIENKWKKRTKRIKKIQKKIDFKKENKFDKNILKTTKNNEVFVKYVKIINKNDLPKHTIGNLNPEIKRNFLVKKILDNNSIIINYYKDFKFFEITWLDDYFCNSKLLNNYLKNNIENKIIFLDNIKKKNTKILKGEFYLNWKNLAKILIENNICKIKK